MNEKPPGYLQGNIKAWQEKAAEYEFSGRFYTKSLLSA